jgi:arylsulfatase A-like enzyme
VSVPGVAGRVVDEPVSLLDLAPTIVELFGTARPPSFRGRSLVRALAGVELPPRPAVAELLPSDSLRRRSRMIVDGNLKLIISSDVGRELFDLAADPDEKHNLAAARSDRAAALTAELARCER